MALSVVVVVVEVIVAVVFIFQKWVAIFDSAFFAEGLLLLFRIIFLILEVSSLDLSCVHINNVPFECDLLTECPLERLFLVKNYKAVNLLFFRVSIGDISFIDRPEVFKKLPEVIILYLLRKVAHVNSSLPQVLGYFVQFLFAQVLPHLQGPSPIGVGV